MNNVIIGYGYIVPTGFYNIELNELVVFECNISGLSFVTFKDKHIFIDFSCEKNVPIDDKLVPNDNEIYIINSAIESYGIDTTPTLQVFTRLVEKNTEKHKENNIINDQNKEYEECLEKDIQKDIEKSIIEEVMKESIKKIEISNKKPNKKSNWCFVSCDPDTFIERKPNEIAEHIINNMSLIINNYEYHVVELEFYYDSLDNLENSNNTEIILLLNDDLDNDLNDGCAFIRSVQTLDGKIISHNNFDNIINQTTSIKLKNNDNYNKINIAEPKIIYNTMRMNLLLNNDANYDLNYIMSPCRYVVETDPVINPKYLVIQMITENKSLMEIVYITGIQKPKVVDLIKVFEKGKKLNDILKYYNKKLSIDDLCMICGFISA